MPILCISKNAICRSLFTEKILFHLQNYKTSEYFSDTDPINTINPLDEQPLCWYLQLKKSSISCLLNSGTYLWKQNITDISGLEPVYTKRQHQCCDNAVMTLALLLPMKTMESLEVGCNPILKLHLSFSYF